MKHLLPSDEHDTWLQKAEATVSPAVLKPFLDAAAAVFGTSRSGHEIVLRFDTDGLSVRAVDGGNAALVEATLPVAACADYAVTSSDAVAVGVAPDELAGLAATLADHREPRDSGLAATLADHREPGDSGLALSVYGPPDTDHDETAWGLTVGVPERIGARARTFATKTVRNEPDVPDLDFDASVLVDRHRFVTAIEAADEQGVEELLVDNGQSEAGKGRLALLSYGGPDAEPRGRVDARLYAGGDRFDADPDGEARAAFTVDYLTDFVAALPDRREVRVSLSDDRPLEVAYELVTPEDRAPDGVGTVGDLTPHVRFMVAPRIPDEDSWRQTTIPDPEWGDGEDGDSE